MVKCGGRRRGKQTEMDKRIKKTASIFSIFCGVAMLVVWGILLKTGQVVELNNQPFEAGFLLGAEFLTAISLILSGTGLVKEKRWGLRMNLVALGMLLYCTVYSIGVFRQEDNIPATIFFIIIAALAGVFSILFIMKSMKGNYK